MIAYLDIETTGLSAHEAQITVIGIGSSRGKRLEVVQLVDDEVTQKRLLGALKGITSLYTYNGGRFDLPFIRHCLGVDLAQRLEHRDLMFDCWRCGLYGGFKAVEERLGIPRRLKGLNGRDAVRLWHEYKSYGDQEALDTLL
ncbi:MAG: ribonuclease H-like domain-containing protein, partial [Chloroflexi bacterium]|nr:ribonuclease H-like domain-containing protein [Chloroflexota bacterium]